MSTETGGLGRGHLSDEEAFDVVDGALAPDRLRHVESCALCSKRVEELRTTVALVQDVPVPEPSPLFWDHLSARVAEAVRERSGDHESAVPGAISWRRFWRFAVPCSAAVASLVLAVAMTRPPRALGDGTLRSAGSDGLVQGESDTALSSLGGGVDPLEFVASMLPDADEMGEMSGAADVFVGGEAFDRALADLSDEEQRTLVDDLKRELGGRGA